MKKILLLLLILIPNLLIGQVQKIDSIDYDSKWDIPVYYVISEPEIEIDTVRRNAISFTYHPEDNGLGIKYDRYIGLLGVYGSYSYGSYNGYDGLFNYYLIEQHHEFALGASFNYRYTHFSAGFNYHIYNYSAVTQHILATALDPVSFEVGIATEIEWIIFGCRMDVMKWEGSFEVGILF